MRWKRGASLCRRYPCFLAPVGPGCGATPRTPLPPGRPPVRHPTPPELVAALDSADRRATGLCCRVAPATGDDPFVCPGQCALDLGIADLRSHLSRGRRRGPLTPDHCCWAQTASSIKSPPSHPLTGLTFSLPSRHSHCQPPHQPPHPPPSPSPIPPTLVPGTTRTPCPYAAVNPHHGGFREEGVPGRRQGWHQHQREHQPAK